MTASRPNAVAWWVCRGRPKWQGTEDKVEMVSYNVRWHLIKAYNASDQGRELDVTANRNRNSET